MDIGNKVRYYFPRALNKEEGSVTGRIDYVGDGDIILLCEDSSWLILSVKDISRLEVIKEREEFLPV